MLAVLLAREDQSTWAFGPFVVEKGFRGDHWAAHRSHDERAWWRQAGIDPIKVARRLWKETHGIGRRRVQRPALRRPHGVATSSDPKNEDMSATATLQEETPLSDLPD
jgi:hypothetical protein